jgi:cytochrome c-type protein NapB
VGGVLLGIFLVACATTAVVALVTAARRAPARTEAPEPATVAMRRAPIEPIRAEAQVFRTQPGMLAIEASARRERTAHPRELATYRFLRAYPGAPPRIPHAVTPEEFRGDACATCHERGGYSQRFDAYVPVTPHPERGICLQCHVGEDSLMGVAIPIANPNARCPQCHGPAGGRPRADASLTWPTTVWPALAPLPADSTPPVIPHDLLFRENCVTCHSGPAAVAEIRTTHPERADCRQCHLEVDRASEPFERTIIGTVLGGTP